MVIYGIDPGVSGAVAVVRDRRLLAVADLPAETVIGSPFVKRRIACAELAALLRALRCEHGDGADLALIEQISAMPRQGAASTFSLGDTAGAIRGVLAALGMPHRFAPARAWKAHYRLGKDKAQARTAASELFPEHAAHWLRVRDHNRAEAVLLARYGWEKFA
jgi:crossover junction endodeoxyribonuclease RuvC